jgi:hypothetical protein
MKTKVRMLVSLASATWSAQPQQVVEVDSIEAEKWIRSGLAAPVPKNTPLSSSDVFDELSAEEARLRVCSGCEQRRGQFVLRNRSFCGQCFRAQLGVGK